MNGWVLAVLVVMAIPLVCVAVLLVGDAQHNRRVRARPERTVAGIRERVKAGRAASPARNRRAEEWPGRPPRDRSMW